MNILFGVGNNLNPRGPSGATGMGKEKELIKFILKNHSWTYVEKFKKHISVDHCRDMIKYHSVYQNKWKNISGIYKITYLPNKLFTYYGSSKNIVPSATPLRFWWGVAEGARLKYHYYLGKIQNNYLGLFLNTFGWSSFSFTLIEQCSEYELKTREDWYLHRFKPLLNYLTFSYRDPAPGRWPGDGSIPPPPPRGGRS